ncbi:MAG: hypothetical protein SGPRY_013142, partial [Prymnesium sp.]
ATLSLAAAWLVALSMSLQRYALTRCRRPARARRARVSPSTLWGCGVGVYALGNGLYSAALFFGPLSLLGGVFTTLLVFNFIFSYKFLGETITRTGALICAVCSGLVFFDEADTMREWQIAICMTGACVIVL